MLLPEVLKKLLELKLQWANNGIKIEDIQTIDSGNYGYIIVLAHSHDDLHNELLELRMKEMNGKKVMPDLWVLGPFIKEEKKSS